MYLKVLSQNLSRQTEENNENLHQDSLLSEIQSKYFPVTSIALDHYTSCFVITSCCSQGNVGLSTLVTIGGHKHVQRNLPLENTESSWVCCCGNH